MHRVFRFLLPVIVALLPAGCAAQSAEEPLSRLESQASSLRALDLRVNHVEERLNEVETAIGEIRQSKDNGGKGAKHSARVRQDARPAVGGEPSPSLPLAKAGESAPLQGPAGLQPDYFSGSFPKFVPPRSGGAAVPVSPTPSPASAQPALPQAFSGPELTLQGMRAPEAGRPVAKSPASPPSRASRGSDVTPTGPTGPTGKKSYDAALAFYYQGNYAKAREAFNAFLRSSPESALAPNALYWQGECLYSLGKYDEAIMIFKDVAAKYPKHDKAAASLLKAGYSYERLNDKENAHFYWQILLDDFPSSAPAGMARKRMAG